MKPLGISFGAPAKRFGFRRGMEIVAESGFNSLDFGLGEFGMERESEGIYSKSDEEIYEFFSDLGAYARSLGLIVGQTHGRFRIVTNDEEYSRMAFESAKRDLLASAALGAPYCVIHSASSYWFPNETNTQIHARNLAFFEALTPYAEKYGVAMVQETFGDTKRDGKRILELYGDSRELLYTYRALNTSHKALCLDSGHTNSAVCVAKQSVGLDVPGVAETIRMFGRDLKVLHLNDNNGFSDQHLLPRTAGGDLAVNWNETLDALEEIGYDGVYNFETNIGVYGSFLEEVLHFFGKYLRALVERTL